MRRLPPLSALRAFEAAARHRSFKHAAAELAVTPTAISHQIRALEDHVGIRLFERHTRQVILKPEAESLYPVLRDGFDAFAQAVARLGAARSRNSVTISATAAFSAKWLLPRMAHFQKAHPEIDLQLHASDEAVDLNANAVDIAIRYGTGPYPGLIAEPLFTDRFAPVANPALKVKTYDDLKRAAFIHFAWRRVHPANPTWRGWFRAAGLSPLSSSQFSFSDESHAIQATVAGQGIALLSLALVADEIAAGRLVQPFGPELQGMTYHLVEPSDRPRTSQIAAAREWLLTETMAFRASAGSKSTRAASRPKASAGKRKAARRSKRAALR